MDGVQISLFGDKYRRFIYTIVCLLFQLEIHDFLETEKIDDTQPIWIRSLQLNYGVVN